MTGFEAIAVVLFGWEWITTFQEKGPLSYLKR